MLEVLVGITEEMQKARACCGEDSDCNECPCHIGTDDCIYNYVSKSMTEDEAIKHVGLYVIGYCEEMPKQVINALDVLRESTRENQKYKAVGSVEEFQKLKERNDPKKWDTTNTEVDCTVMCPVCKKKWNVLDNDTQDFDHCPKCGQKLK